MNFGRTLQQPAGQNQPTRVKANPDGSFTYELADSSIKMLYYVRVYPDRTCLLQAVEQASGKVSLEETGRLGGLVVN